MEQKRGPFLTNPFVARAARWGLVAWSVIGLLILVYVTYRYALYPIRIIFPPLVVALIVIYLLNPIVNVLERQGVPRIWGTLLVYVVFLSAAGVAMAYLGGVIAHQVTQFAKGVPGLLDRAGSALAAVSKRLGLHIDTSALIQALQPGKGGAYNFVGRLTSFTSGVAHVALVLVLGPLIAFYLVVDLPKLQRGARALVPPNRREEVAELASRLGSTLGGFFRGQLLAGLIIGLVSMFGFYVVGLPYFALLGAVTGLFGLVPLIGTVIAAVPVLFVALTASHHSGGLLHVAGGWKLALASAAVLVLVQQLDVRVISRRLIGRASRMHPVSVLLSLLVGGTLLGLWGMLLAVPAVAALKVTILFFWDTRAQWPPRYQVGPVTRVAGSDESPAVPLRPRSVPGPARTGQAQERPEAIERP